MMMNPKDEASLAGWEGEGGSLGTASSGTAVLGHVSCLPTLPFEHVAQPVWGFLDSTGRFSYELSHVYGAPRLLRGARGESARLDEAASYWGVTWAERDEGGDEHPAGRWVTFARARELLGRRLSFDKFCSPGYMRSKLPIILLACLFLAPLGCGNRESRAATAPAQTPATAPAQTPVAEAPVANPKLDTTPFAEQMPAGWRELRWGMSPKQVSAIMKRQKWAPGSDPWKNIRAPDGLTILAPDDRFLVVAPQAPFACWSACGLEGASCVHAWFLDGKLVEVVAQAPHDIGNDAFERRATESYAAKPRRIHARVIRLRGKPVADAPDFGDGSSSEPELLYWSSSATTAVLYEPSGDTRPQVVAWSTQAMPHMWAALLAKQADEKAAADRVRQQREDATRF